MRSRRGGGGEVEESNKASVRPHFIIRYRTYFN
jgi:hypothetical protein